MYFIVLLFLPRSACHNSVRSSFCLSESITLSLVNCVETARIVELLPSVSVTILFFFHVKQPDEILTNEE